MKIIEHLFLTPGTFYGGSCTTYFFNRVKLFEWSQPPFIAL